MSNKKIMAKVVKISEKREQVELSKEGVELGLVQDLKSDVDKYEADKKSLLSIISEIAKLKSKAKSELNKHNATNKTLSKNADKLFSKLNDLGVDSKDVFKLQAKIATIHSKGFDGDVVNFIQK